MGVNCPTHVSRRHGESSATASASRSALGGVGRLSPRGNVVARFALLSPCLSPFPVAAPGVSSLEILAPSSRYGAAHLHASNLQSRRSLPIRQSLPPSFVSSPFPRLLIFKSPDCRATLTVACLLLFRSSSSSGTSRFVSILLPLRTARAPPSGRGAR
ncbi:uncharacterized protein K452DRAFT_168797 [Aplosporella prunicola CBS 121167]|uniref:Uncharacterized protein n=1 Tax=Aplosporella prunicola CBS 121167 TaxID=1176127 RepID=A0A6A6BH42_9PEZI|nr:uncharacterized protein K452DRAFT_168797 [Aplosporella prunicola CBS 121167]KAF2143296.1 hypothetical protein K452DRAFT_168797 [Aplosporella prunicola CBS 121167]